MKKRESIRVVLADRDAAYMEKVKFCLERDEQVDVVGMVDHGEGVINLLREKQPDVILMDIVLSGKDGISVLEAMNAMSVKPETCIIISAMDSDAVVRKVMTLGADYFMAKPIQGSILMERIKSLLESQQEDSQREEINAEMVLSKEWGNELENLEFEISNLLSRMGMSASIKGYHYIRKAVLLAIEDQEALIGITKRLYPDIAKFYKTSASKVERAIRHAIESSWKKNGQVVYAEFAGYCSENKPTNGQFIAAMSEYLRLRFKKKSMKTTA